MSLPIQKVFGCCLVKVTDLFKSSCSSYLVSVKLWLVRFMTINQITKILFGSESVPDVNSGFINIVGFSTEGPLNSSCFPEALWLKKINSSFLNIINDIT